MNKRLIIIMTLVLSLLCSVPAFADVPAVVDNYQISIYAIAIHNQTDGKWYLLNNNRGAAGDKRTIDFTITAPNWLGSYKLTPGHYDQVAMVVGDDVKYRAHYGVYATDGTRTNNGNQVIYNDSADTNSNIDDMFNAPPTMAVGVSHTPVNASLADKFVNAVPTAKVETFMWNPSASNLIGKTQLIQNISLDLSETSNSASIEVNWDTTGCIQVDNTGEGVNPSLTITEIRPPQIVFNFHN